MITAFSTFHIKPDQIDTFLEITRDNMARVRKEPGSVEMRLYKNNNEPGVFHLFGRTSSAEEFAAHEKDIIARKVPERTAPTVAAPPVSLPLIETEADPDPMRKQPGPDDDMVTLFFPFEVKEGSRDTVLAQMQKHVIASRREPANLTFEFYAVEGEPNKFLVYERWRNEAAIWDIHMQQPHAQETGVVMSEALIGNFEDLLIRVTEIDAY